MTPPPPRSTLFPYTTLFRSSCLLMSNFVKSIDILGNQREPNSVVATESGKCSESLMRLVRFDPQRTHPSDRIEFPHEDRKSTRLNSSHVSISYAVFCLKKKT